MITLVDSAAGVARVCKHITAILQAAQALGGELDALSARIVAFPETFRCVCARPSRPLGRLYLICDV
jgi:hypothetical protein